MPLHPSDIPSSPMTQWRKDHPEQARKQRDQELANRKAKRLAIREEADRQRQTESPKATKACSVCGGEKPFYAFNKKSRSKDGYRPECRDCQHAYALANKHRAQARQQSKKTEYQAYNRVYHHLHREQIAARHTANRLKNPDAYARQQAAYRTANLEYFRVAASRRRARQRDLPDTWTTEQEAFMFDYWHHACAACGNPKGLLWTLASDHWFPLTSPDCPGTVATNMIPLCHGKNACNTSKHKSDPSTWLNRRFGPEKAVKIEQAIATYFAIVAERFTHA